MKLLLLSICLIILQESHSAKVKKTKPKDNSDSSEYVKKKYGKTWLPFLSFIKKKYENVQCPVQPVVCGYYETKYRTFDGTCNNLIPGRRQWGASDRPQVRVLPPDFADGVGAPRVASDGSALPTARKVSGVLFGKKSTPSAIHTVMLMTCGQFLIHDIVNTPVTTKFDEETGKNEPVFCGDDNCDKTENCFGIPPDPSSSDQNCTYFVRSKIFQDDCSHRNQGNEAPREIINSATGYMDLSTLYGNSRKQAEELWNVDEKRGRMKVSEHPIHKNLKPILPFADNEESMCKGVNDVIRCFVAGDDRVNDQVGLTSLHTIMVRLHNEIEQKLYQQNKYWDGETLFQETRKIVIAIYQHIIFNEYLPIILGPYIMEKYQLNPKKYRKHSYDRNIRADMSAGASSAAFRFGHSLIPVNMTFANKRFEVQFKKRLSEVLFNPSTIYSCPMNGSSGIDSIFLGMVSARAETLDRFFSEQIKKSLFTDDPPDGKGFDLLALNIQRSRDHGIPGYQAWRIIHGLDEKDTPWDFSDLKDIDSDAQELLGNLYESPKDVDLFAAGITEHPIADGLIGPTFANIAGSHFRKLKKGDRFFYENKNKYGFTNKQLAEIKKFTLAHILCLTLDHIDEIQPFVLLQAKEEVQQRNLAHTGYIYKRFLHKNYRQPCSDLPQINYSKLLPKSKRHGKSNGKNADKSKYADSSEKSNGKNRKAYDYKKRKGRKNVKKGGNGKKTYRRK